MPPPPQNLCAPRGSDRCYAWTRQLGQIDVRPEWWPPSMPWPGDQPQPPLPELPAPGELPAGVVSESECIAREQEAARRARQEESAKVIKTAAVSAAVSVVVGAAVGYLLR